MFSPSTSALNSSTELLQAVFKHTLFHDQLCSELRSDKLTRRSGRTSLPLRSGLSFPMPNVDVQAAAWALTRKALSEAVARSDALHKSQEKIKELISELRGEQTDAFHLRH
jgi:hypothetical protein